MQFRINISNACLCLVEYQLTIRKKAIIYEMDHKLNSGMKKNINENIIMLSLLGLLFYRKIVHKKS